MLLLLELLQVVNTIMVISNQYHRRLTCNYLNITLITIGSIIATVKIHITSIERKLKKILSIIALKMFQPVEEEVIRGEEVEK